MKTNRLYQLLEDPDHCVCSEYPFNMILCVKPVCGLCPSQYIRTPTAANGEICKHVHEFMSLPIVNPLGTSTYLFPEESRKKVEAGMSMEDQLKHLPVLSHAYKKKKLMTESKTRDKQHLKGVFHYSKA